MTFDAVTGFLDSLVPYAPAVVFWIFAVAAVVASVMVVVAKSPVHAALFLLGMFLSVAGIFISQGAEFVGAAQVLVYAGGIMVLFLFVVMLVRRSDAAERGAHGPHTRMAVVLGLLLLTGVVTVAVAAARTAIGPAADAALLGTVPPEVAALGFPARSGHATGNSEAVGLLLYTRYLLPFEIASVLLLVALVGAILMGRKQVGNREVER